MPAAVSIRGVRRAFDGVPALDAIDLEIEEGAFVAWIGPSGCGKSTLLRLVAGLDRADAGKIEVSSQARGDVGFVFQDAHLLPWRTVAQNVELPLQLRGVDASERADRVRRALEDVELTDAASRRPAELSGGMRMRASIARALVTRPRLLLMDEPFAALDEITRHRLDERLRALWIDQKLTVLFVTHTIFEATFLAERAIVFSRRPGRVVHDAPIDLPRDRPASIRTSSEFARAAQMLLEALEKGAA
jgi:NitT/TauT family transport system ATP-binding protein